MQDYSSNSIMEFLEELLGYQPSADLVISTYCEIILKT